MPDNKPLTIDEAANLFEKEYLTSSDIFSDAEKFKKGAAWQKEKDKTLAMKLQGMQPWITDRELQAIFTETINQLINP